MLQSSANSIVHSSVQGSALQGAPIEYGKGFSRRMVKRLWELNPDAPSKPSFDNVKTITVGLGDAYRSVGGVAGGVEDSETERIVSELNQHRVLFAIYNDPKSKTRAIRMNAQDVEARGLKPVEGIDHYIFLNGPLIRKKKPAVSLLTWLKDSLVTRLTPYIPRIRIDLLKFRSRKVGVSTVGEEPRETKPRSLKPYIGQFRNITQLLKMTAKEITVNNITLSRYHVYGLYLYRALITKPKDFLRRKRDMMREEIFHCIQDVRGISAQHMSSAIAEREGISPFFKEILTTPLKELKDKRDKGASSHLDDVWRKFVYLWRDREFMAKLDKVLLRSGRVPKNKKEIIPLMQELGFALGGLSDLKRTKLWDRAKINGEYSASIAELNIALVAAFPEGLVVRKTSGTYGARNGDTTAKWILDKALPYYFAVREYTERSDLTVFSRFGFDAAETALFLKDARIHPAEISFAFEDPKGYRQSLGVRLAKPEAVPA